MAHTLKDLEQARCAVEEAQARIDNHRANNPDFGRADLRSAMTLVSIIALELKMTGVLPWTEKEKLEKELNKRFPKAQSKDIVEYGGKRYQLRFRPAQMSRSGKNVMEWDRSWEEL